MPAHNDFAAAFVDHVRRDIQASNRPVRLPKVPTGKLGIYRATVTAHNDDTLTCTMLLADGTSGDSVTVAKSPELRKTFYDGKTINGVAYVYVAAGERTADGTTEKITPDYVANTTVVFCVKPANGSGDSTTEWLDLNVDGRAWAVE